MIRSNIGNVATNATQILSVGATTAARTLGKAETALNNLSDEERKRYFGMKADKMRDELRQYETKGRGAYQHLSDEELTAYRKKQAENIRKYIGEDEETDVEEIMSESESSVPSLENNSPQVEELNLKIKRDADWLSNWADKAFPNNRNITSKANIEELKKHLRGEDNNADV